MAYGRRKTKRRSFGKTRKAGRARRTYSSRGRYSRKPKSRARKSSKRSSSRTVKHVLVIRHEPITPTLATPQARAKPVRARFGG